MVIIVVVVIIIIIIIIIIMIDAADVRRPAQVTLMLAFTPAPYRLRWNKWYK